MDAWIERLITVLVSVLASSGFWAFLMARMNKNDVRSRMLLGIGHDRIIYLATKYIDQGYISADDYENLYEYLYKPYLEMGGNGSAKRMMNRVEKLPIRKDGQEM